MNGGFLLDGILSAGLESMQRDTIDCGRPNLRLASIWLR